ncbi:MAG: phosphogluconate dehydrogenase (NAD(+)-dependent, decarboxylating) [Rubricoccaceae bacterium]
MELGLVGLGRMGLGIAERLARAGHRVVATDRDPAACEAARAAGIETVADAPAVARALAPPRAVWLMLPAGDVTQRVVDEVLPALAPGDTLVDGANSRYTDALARAEAARPHGIAFVDAGVSGGIWGLENGYCLMIGGPDEAVDRLTPIWQALAPAPDRGWAHLGPTGAGHFAKMVHNGIEYGLMQAYAEGFALLAAKEDLGGQAHRYDLARLAETWRHGSVVRSWLLELAADALAERPRLEGLAPYVPDSGHGRWTVEEAIALAVPVPVIASSLFARFESRTEASFAHKLLSALRGGFGGHPVRGLPGAEGLAPDGTIQVVPEDRADAGADTAARAAPPDGLV